MNHLFVLMLLGLTCVDCGDSTNRRPEVEVKSIVTPFDGTGTFPAGSGYDYVDVTGLSAGNYHLRVRAIDDQGRASGWTSYGGNTDGQTDFSIDQTPPEGTITINNGATLTNTENVTVSVTASDSNSKLGKLFLSNDGTTWQDKTPASGFTGETTYSGNITWTLIPGEDGTRNVYLRVVDNGGSESGSIKHSSQLELDGTLSSSAIEVTNNGEIQLTKPAETIIVNDTSGSYTCYDPPACENIWSETSTYNRSWANEVRVNWSWNLNWGVGNAYADLYIPSTNKVKSYLNPSPKSGSETTSWYSGNSVKARFEGGYDGQGSVTLGTIDFRASNYSSSETYTSLSIPNSGIFRSISWNDKVTAPNGGSVTMKVRGSDNSNMSGATAWSDDVPKGGVIPDNIKSKPYIQYQLTLNSGNSQTTTPIVYDVSLVMAVGTSITLDTQPPGDFGLVSPANNIWSATEPNPIFTWSASSGHDKYQLWIDGELDTDGIDAGVTSITASAPLDEGNHTWLVKAVDAAENVTEALGGARNYGYDATPPPNVTGLTAPTGDATPNSIMVRWTAVTDVGSGVVGYRLERKRYDSATWDGPTYASYNLGTITSYNDTGLDQGYRYNYRIKAYDSVNLSSLDYATVEGYTVDTIPPSEPSGVTAVATASGDTAGYEISLAWNPSTDNGSGLEKYKVWRRAATNDTREVNNSGQDITNTETQVWTLIGVVTGPGPISANWVDNDINNDAVVDVKTVVSPRLNDYTNYHYRVVAIDAAGNHSKIITVDPVLGLPDYTNYKSERTVDVTAPSTPGNVTVTPTGVDSLGGEPLTQAMEVTWGAATDTRTPGRVPTGNGSGVKNYKLYQSKGDVNGPTEAFTLIETVSGTSYTKEGLAEDSYYYYKVRAVDNSDNESTDSDESGALTKNSQVPTTPTNVNVTAKTGDPNLDTEVGSKITINLMALVSRVVVTELMATGFIVPLLTLPTKANGRP
jgi:hypothetical protein